MTDDAGFEIDIALVVNGVNVKRRVSARQHLADFLRDDLSLTGTHLGCEHGVCGACTVRVDGRVVRGCLMLAVQANGDSGILADLQAAFLARNAAQCGFCTSGMLLTASEFLAEGRKVSRQEIRDLLSGNLCRCTGYQAIVDAVEAVMMMRPGK
jgi:aerobic carbon-monoxide dehydrogenase small subunit